ncbi:hypothetical protein NP493_5991g00000 [Ridgeia piscesae]|uniref:Uncharacterized protein n=1 Tax=Ridgeia piscesae TaxID=27915 RepID=A0AAD9ISV8_RIDPI|nr:hypothetical protein NP493_5991g00000 [Ridgeia piscesae]
MAPVRIIVRALLTESSSSTQYRSRSTVLDDLRPCPQYRRTFMSPSMRRSSTMYAFMSSMSGWYNRKSSGRISSGFRGRCTSRPVSPVCGRRF